jgi:hypothetical protein
MNDIKLRASLAFCNLPETYLSHFIAVYLHREARYNISAVGESRQHDVTHEEEGMIRGREGHVQHSLDRKYFP